ncbi:hypothetical protein AGMMS50229_13450 [Campylobacterota bacterium]|nr:hypothetical protein AGMMS50229_13450 [Campylobacterota bacterium]
MKKIEAETLDQAYTRAALEFACSITELDIEVVQEPSKGFVGLFKKSAIIMAVKKHETLPQQRSRPSEPAPAPRAPREVERPVREPAPEPQIAVKTERYETPQPTPTPAPTAPAKPSRPEPQPLIKPRTTAAADRVLENAFADAKEEPFAPMSVNIRQKIEEKRVEEKRFDEKRYGDKRFDDKRAPAKEKIFDKPQPPRHADFVDTAFNDKNLNQEQVCEEIQSTLRDLFANTCYQIELIEVTPYDEKTVKVLFDGVDAALLIGKDGYRYKALSYILFNWINPTYGYLLRLEIAEFLQNQEEMIARYLEPVIESIEQNGKGQTRVLDGVLVQIALKELRNRFPNKYVAIKSTSDGEGKLVVVNDFIRRYDK